MDHLNLHAIDDYEFGARIHGVLFPSSPIQTHEFLFGRDDQMERIRRALMAPGRQVFIYGERGVGKSSLATAAATELQSSDANPLHASCGKQSTFSSVIWSLIRDTGSEPANTVTVRQGAELSAEVLKLARQTETTTPASVAPMQVEEAARRLDAAFLKYSRQTVAVVDEFDLIASSDERNMFAELIKALGDRKSNAKIIFTGVASALDELLESHGSAHRQLDTIELKRLDYQPRLHIINKALRAFDLVAHDSVIYRIANVSNGFPYYVHLLTEHLLWAWYGDPLAEEIGLKHLHIAFERAADAVHADLRRPYDKATSGRDHAAYTLWAAADAFDLERTIEAIWGSYCQICDTLRIEPLGRTQFTGLLRRLRDASHGCVLSTVPGRKVYRYSEAMVRGYVRMAAACKNIQLDDQEFDPPPQIIHAPRQSSRKRWMDPGRYIPNVKFGKD